MYICERRDLSAYHSKSVSESWLETQRQRHFRHFTADESEKLGKQNRENSSALFFHICVRIKVSPTECECVCVLVCVYCDINKQ